MKSTQYFEINKDRREWLGVRYFKWLPASSEVIQICVAPGDPRRGKSNNFGIYTISQMTFFSNYMAMGYAVPCSERIYKKAFEVTLNALKQ